MNVQVFFEHFYKANKILLNMEISKRENIENNEGRTGKANYRRTL